MATDRIALVEELQEKFDDAGVSWPFEGPYEWVWKGETRLYDIESYDSGWGRNVVSGTGEAKVKELAVMYRGAQLLLTQVADELDKLYRPEEVRAYLLEIVETGKTRKQRAREESDEQDRRWREIASSKFHTIMSLSQAQRLWVDLYLAAPRVAEKIDSRKLGEWMSDLSWGMYTPGVKDVLERLHEFGLPAELALPEPPAPKVETPEELRERKAREKFGKSYSDLPRQQKLWTLYWIQDPVKAEKISPQSIERWMKGKGSQPLTGLDVKNAVDKGNIR